MSRDFPIQEIVDVVFEETGKKALRQLAEALCRNEGRDGVRSSSEDASTKVASTSATVRRARYGRISC